MPSPHAPEPRPRSPSLMSSSPRLLPRKKPVDRKVFLEEDLWKELSDAAEFHTKVFEELGSDEKVSRNDIIDTFLRWALDAYWDDKGGKPKNATDGAAKVKRHAEKLLHPEKKQG
jgi:hypothetical protein